MLLNLRHDPGDNHWDIFLTSLILLFRLNKSFIKVWGGVNINDKHQGWK